MKQIVLLLLVLLGFTSACQTSATGSKTAGAKSAAARDTRFYEMRVYYAAPGKLADLNNRFRTNTTRIFEKHGMTNIGYWEPIDNPENKIIYFLAYPSREARDASWKAFGADPEWQAVAKASEANGRLVAKVDTWYLEATDYSPAIQPAAGAPGRIFELRTYTASPNNIENLHARFREHTLKLFAKHGMTNIAYWRPVDKEGAKKDMLIYILAHPSVEAGKANFEAFRADPAWVKAKQASEDKGGGSLTTKVESVYMRATDYSTIK
jgi:NIPSNAP